MQKARTLFFTAPGQVEVREQSLPPMQADQLLVETICSGISSGSELLVYRGQFPKALADAHDLLSTNLKFPLAYGYSCVGRVKAQGASVAPDLKDKLVFAFQPHTSHFLATLDAVYPVPDNVSPETACFLPSMETAVALVQDAAPQLGERALVLGQGVVGLLCAALLSAFPLAALVTADNYPMRRRASLELSLAASHDPRSPDFLSKCLESLGAAADLTLELSGQPETLNHALAMTAFSGRVIVGSWYGEKRAQLDLGGSFHRSRIRLVSSQVSTIAPELSGRWDKARRLAVAWKALERIRPEKWITNSLPVEEARAAFELLDKHPQDAIQILLHYTQDSILEK